MTEEFRNNLTPLEYIRRMFAETENGKFTVEYKDPDNNFAMEKRTLELNWTAEEARMIEEKYNMLTSALTRIGRLHDRLEDEDERKALLSADDLEIWNVYVKRFEPMEVNWAEFYPIPPCEADELIPLIFAIRERGRYGDLIEEESALWEKYCMWEEEQSQKRIPFNRRSSLNMITRAMRYEKLISVNAPEVVVVEEGRCLAEEMVLYHFGKEEPLVWD